MSSLLRWAWFISVFAALMLNKVGVVRTQQITTTQITWKVNYDAIFSFYLQEPSNLYFVSQSAPSPGIPPSQFITVVDPRLNQSGVPEIVLPNGMLIQKLVLLGDYPVFLDLTTSPVSLYWMNMTTLIVFGPFHLPSYYKNDVQLFSVDPITVLIYSGDPSMPDEKFFLMSFDRVCFNIFPFPFFAGTNPFVSFLFDTLGRTTT